MTPNTSTTDPYARAYLASNQEQELPDTLLIKRAKSMVGLYRAEVLAQIHQYRIWLAKSEYLRISGLLSAPRTHPQYIARIRTAWKHYRAEQNIMQGIVRRGRDNECPLNTITMAEEIGEQALQEYLELKYGILFAQNILDEMRKVKSKGINNTRRNAA